MGFETCGPNEAMVVSGRYLNLSFFLNNRPSYYGLANITYKKPKHSLVKAVAYLCYVIHFSM